MNLNLIIYQCWYYGSSPNAYWYILAAIGLSEGFQLPVSICNTSLENLTNNKVHNNTAPTPKTKKFQKTLPNLKIAAHYRYIDCNHSVPDFCFASCTNMFSISRVARYNETNKKTSNRGHWSNHHQKGLARCLLLLYIKVITTEVALLREDFT